MIKFFSFIKSIFALNSRLKQEEGRQLSEGYSIESGRAGPERYDIYRVDGKAAYLVTEFSWLNDVIVFTDSFSRWSRPLGESLSDLDFQLAKARIERYFECWGGDVIFDDTPLSTGEDFTKNLNDAGIPYKIDEDGVIHYTVDIELERKRKGGFFDR